VSLAGFIGVALVVVALHGASEAAEWRIEPAIGVAGEVDDNADLVFRTDEEQEISGYVIDASADFAYRSSLTSFSFLPRLLSRNYGDPDYDSDDQFAKLSWRREGRSTSFSIRGNYARELARTAERVDVDFNENPDDIPVDTTGRTLVRGRRERIYITPNFSYRLSDLSSIGLVLRYTDTTYDEELAGLLDDYNDTRVNIDYRRAWSERNNAILSATFREFDSKGQAPVTGYGLMAGVESRLSEKTTFRAVVGAENTELDDGVESLNPVGSISLTRELQTIRLYAEYRRTISGGGGGALTARDMVNLNFTRDLNDRITAGLGVRAYTTTALEEGVRTIDERDYVQLRATLIINLSPTMSVQTDYRYTVLNREQIGESANSNNIMLWLNWHPRPFTRSL